MSRLTIEDIEVASKRVLMRVDFNVPRDGGEITDDRRIRMALPSIRAVIERGGKLILMSHLGRPRGDGFEKGFSLRCVANRLGELLPGVKISFGGEDCIGDDARQLIEAMNDGEIVLLENLRFHKGEKKGDNEFAAKLATYADIYCNEAFGTAHREDASMVAVPRAMAGKPRVAGLLLEKELKYLGDLIAAPVRPFIAVLGGAKVSDKMGAIENLIGKVDSILIGGAMAYTLLKSQGHEVGASLIEEERLSDAGRMIESAETSSTKLVLPEDHVCSQEISSESPVVVTDGPAIEAGWMGLDIGPKTLRAYLEIIQAAKTIIWNGPMGVFETKPFDVGTSEVARAMVEATKKGATSVVGGGDSAAAVEVMGLADGFTHVSTGGGASLSMLEGKPFASVQLLDWG